MNKKRIIIKINKSKNIMFNEYLFSITGLNDIGNFYQPDIIFAIPIKQYRQFKNKMLRVLNSIK